MTTARIPLLLTLIVPLAGHAQSDEDRDIYFGISHGNVTATIHESDIERRIMETPGLVTSSYIQNESPYNDISVGWCPWWERRFCLEAKHIDNIHMLTRTTIESFSGSVTPMILDFGGTPLTIDAGSIGASLIRELDVSVDEFSVLGRFPLNPTLSPFVQISEFHYLARMHYRFEFPNPYGAYLGYDERKTGMFVAGSLGLDVNVNSRLFLRGVYTGIGTDRGRSLDFSVLYWF